MSLANWSRAQSLASAASHDFLGGDFYSGRDEQLVVTKLMVNLTESMPPEFMTSVASDLTEHETLKSQEQLDLLTFAATANASAFLGIVGIDPDGGINPAALDRLRQSFRQNTPYEALLGGVPIEDVAVYFSSDSKMAFSENGTLLSELQTSGSNDYPHFHAVKGACRALQMAHVPFGVITRKQLHTLGGYRVVVLGNVLRMDAEECDAFRAYVKHGGALYASRLTSLTRTSGTRYTDFALADVFGASFLFEEQGRQIYLEPASELAAAAMAPQRRISHPVAASSGSGAVRLKSSAGVVLARLTLPYAYPAAGSVDDREWSSIHSSPPTDMLDSPTIVRHAFGAGEAIYSAADIEVGAGPGEALFLAIIASLIGDVAPSFSSDAPGCVWVVAFDQAAESRTILSLLNYQVELPAIPLGPISVWVRERPERRVARVWMAPGGESIACKEDGEGMRVVLPGLSVFSMIVIEYKTRVEGADDGKAEQ